MIDYDEPLCIARAFLKEGVVLPAGPREARHAGRCYWRRRLMGAARHLTQARSQRLAGWSSSEPAGRVARGRSVRTGVTPAARMRRSIASIVSAEGLKLPGRKPSAIIS